MEFHTVDELFSILPVSEVRKILVKTEEEASEASSSLRSAVSTHYEDLLQTADEVNVMLLGVRQLVERINELQASAVTFFKTRPSTVGVPHSQVGDASVHERFVEWVHLCIESFHLCMENYEYYRAALLLVALKTVMHAVTDSRVGAPQHANQIYSTCLYLKDIVADMNQFLLDEVFRVARESSEKGVQGLHPSSFLAAMSAVIAVNIHNNDADTVTTQLHRAFLQPCTDAMTRLLQQKEVNADVGDSIVSAAEYFVCISKCADSVASESSNAIFRIAAEVFALLELAKQVGSSKNIREEDLGRLQGLVYSGAAGGEMGVYTWQSAEILPFDAEKHRFNDGNVLITSLNTALAEWRGPLVEDMLSALPVVLAKAFGLPERFAQQHVTDLSSGLQHVDVSKSFTLLHGLISKLRSRCEALDGRLAACSMRGASSYDYLFAKPLSILSKGCNFATLAKRLENTTALLRATLPRVAELCGMEAGEGGSQPQHKGNVTIALEGSSCKDVAVCDDADGVANGVSAMMAALIRQHAPWAAATPDGATKAAAVYTFLSSSHGSRIHKWESDHAATNWAGSIGTALWEAAACIHDAILHAVQEFNIAATSAADEGSGKEMDPFLCNQLLQLTAELQNSLLCKEREGGDGGCDNNKGGAPDELNAEGCSSTENQLYGTWLIAVVASELFWSLQEPDLKGAAHPAPPDVLLASLAHLGGTASMLTANHISSYALKPVQQYWNDTVGVALKAASDGRTKAEAAKMWRAIQGNWVAIRVQDEMEPEKTDQADSADQVHIHVPSAPSPGLAHTLQRLRSHIDRIGLEPEVEKFHRPPLQDGWVGSPLAADGGRRHRNPFFWLQLLTHTALLDHCRHALQTLYTQAAALLQAAVDEPAPKEQAILQALFDVSVWGHVLGGTATVTVQPIKQHALPSSAAKFIRGAMNLKEAIPLPLTEAVAQAVRDSLDESQPETQAHPRSCSDIWCQLAESLDAIELALTGPHVEALAADSLKSHALSFNTIAPSIPYSGLTIASGTESINLHVSYPAADAATELAVEPPTWRLSDILTHVSISTFASPAREKANTASGSLSSLINSLASSRSPMYSPRTLLLLCALPAPVATAEYELNEHPAVPTLQSSAVARIPLLPIPMRINNASAFGSHAVKASLLPFSSPANHTPHALGGMKSRRGAAFFSDYLQEESGHNVSNSWVSTDETSAHSRADNNSSGILGLPTRFIASSLVALTGSQQQESRSGGNVSTNKLLPAGISGAVSSYLDLLLSGDR